jgi:hypothetical protein
MPTQAEAEHAVDAALKMINAASKYSFQLTPDILNDPKIGLPIGYLPVIRLVDSFLNSMPYEVATYRTPEFGMKVYTRVDIMASFKRFALAQITNVCPDCGQPMDKHNPGEHDPPNLSVH